MTKDVRTLVVNTSLIKYDLAAGVRASSPTKYDLAANGVKLVSCVLTLSPSHPTFA